MAIPKRGEVWRVDWSSGKQGTELATGKWPPERACLVISHERFFVDRNGERVGDRLTIVPFTEYKPRKEVERSLWSVIITNRDDVINRDPVSDDDEHPDMYPELEQLEEWVKDEDGNFIFQRGGGKIPYQSIIDCGQLWTIYVTSSADPFNDFRWDRRYGELKSADLSKVDAALQTVVGGGVRYGQELEVQEGHVLKLNLPERNRYFTDINQDTEQLCLVVSSPGIDVVRDNLNLGHCTVVPLEPEQSFTNSDGEADIIFYSEKDQREIEHEMLVIAQCDEVYTIDWRARSGVVIGRILENDMKKVREELSKYLGLPR